MADELSMKQTLALGAMGFGAQALSGAFAAYSAASAARIQASYQDLQNQREVGLATLQAQNWLTAQLKGFSVEMKAICKNAEVQLDQQSKEHEERLAEIENKKLELNLRKEELAHPQIDTSDFIKSG